MPIFWPTTKSATLATGTFVEPAGIVITGPSGRGCHSVVLLLAAVPMLKTLRALLDMERMDDTTKQSFLAEIDRSLARVEQSIRDKRWPIEPHERVY